MTYQVAFHCVLLFHLHYFFLEPGFGWWILAFECIRAAKVIYSASIKPVIRSSFVLQLRSAAWSWEERTRDFYRYYLSSKSPERPTQPWNSNCQSSSPPSWMRPWRRFTPWAPCLSQASSLVSSLPASEPMFF